MKQNQGLLTRAAAVGELAYCYRVQATTPGALSETELRELQLHRLNETLAWARQHCGFHKTRIPKSPLKSLAELHEIPLMDYTAFSRGMAALSGMGQDDISRIVTVLTSGTTGPPKSIAFSENEQEDIIAYLASGMRMLARSGETIMVLYPCERPGGLGQLICEGIARMPARAIPYGLPDREKGFAHLAQTCIDQQVQGLVGFPQHIFALARWCEYQGIELPLQAVLLSADNVVPCLKHEIARILKARVFAHYGTTEMGYGGAVECGHGNGLHVRETDLLFEVIDSSSGQVLPVGEWGELVFTTLDRKAMPFIRYRTGDITRLLPDVCPCGSILRRIDSVKARVDETTPISMYDLEETLFPLPGVLDFSAEWDATSATLTLRIHLLPGFSIYEDELQTLLEAKLGTVMGERVHDCRVIQANVDLFLPFYPAKRSLLTNEGHSFSSDT
jgi:phenylacetate-coenzyme A ligase PaaK-like adenylate-forming protein